LIADQNDTRLAVQYESIRRQEFELITHLLQILPKIDGVGDDQLAQMRDALFHADTPYLMVFVGPFNSGKSSLINALLGKDDLLPVGITPTTDRITMLRHGDTSQRARMGDTDIVFYPSLLLQKVSFVDTPGLESIFKTHEEETRRFLHRSDVVMLIMLATQAMTAGDLDNLRLLKEYGKTVIIILNQRDLLTDDKVEEVRQHVADQSRVQLGYQPDIWLMSARWGNEARQADGSVDDILWEKSGLSQLERYLDRQLNDAARLRQKLQTPLQITQNIHQAALNAVRGNQSALNQYQSLSQNIESQMTGYKRELDTIARTTLTEITAKFDEAALRGEEAVREVYGIGRLPVAFVRGLGELTGLRRIAEGDSVTKQALLERKALEPLDEVRDVADQLAPRLEGKDVQDVDDLIKYANREIDALPVTIRGKVIGSLQAPALYDRSMLQDARNELDEQERLARTVIPKTIDKAVRTSDVYFAAYEVIVLLFLAFVLLAPIQTPDTPNLKATLILVLVILSILGAGANLFRGSTLSTSYGKRMKTAGVQYQETLQRAADKQIGYGMRLRQEAVAPLTRLIDAQTDVLTDQLLELQNAGKEMVAIEAALTKIK